MQSATYKVITMIYAHSRGEAFAKNEFTSFTYTIHFYILYFSFQKKFIKVHKFNLYPI